jgi:hypothetical protein
MEVLKQVNVKNNGPVQPDPLNTYITYNLIGTLDAVLGLTVSYRND